MPDHVLATMLLPVLLAFVLSGGLTYWLARSSGSWGLDYPNERSLHSIPVPRTGGLAIVVAIMLSAALAFLFARAHTPTLWLMLGLAAVGIVSLYDDRFGLNVGFRLAAHVIAALCLVWAGLYIEEVIFPGGSWNVPAAIGVGVSVLFIVWMINLYNFMDGMDGLAAGMAVFGFGTFGLLGWFAHAPVFAALNWIVAAAAGGFLVWNFPPARIFMGDTGSSVLGYSAAVTMLWGEHAGIAPMWLGIIVFSPFIVDATVTLLRRALKGERVWEAHKTHFYQRLVQLGWGHRRTALWEYVLMLACSVSALVASRASNLGEWIVLGGWTAIYIVLMLSIRRREAVRRPRIAI